MLGRGCGEVAVQTATAATNSVATSPYMANEGNRRQAVGADFTRRTTTRPRASSFNGGSLADLDELRDELDDLNTMEHPIFDALERDTVAHTQQRIRTP